jgi:hypothetical protein
VPEDTTRDEQAFVQLEARLAELPRAEIEEPRASPERAAATALAVAELCARPEVRERFSRLAAAGLFELALLDELPLAARAARHARQLLVQTSAAASSAQLPSELLAEAGGQRNRMLKVLDYNCGEDPGVAARLAAVRGGKGHFDLGNDLLVLADLYRANRTLLALDQRHYRAADEEAARAIAGRIFSALSASGAPGVGRWTELQARSWTHLARIYGEVRRAGQFLFYHEDPEARFPALGAGAPRGTRTQGHAAAR